MRVLFDFQDLESRGLKSPTEGARVNWHEDVTDVDQPHEQALQAVAAHKNSARLDDPPDFAEKLVLQFGRGHVMKHRETDYA